MNSKVTLIYVDAGGGHRAAATALREAIRRQNRPWDIEMVATQDIFSSVDFIRKYTGIQFQDVYNIILRRGWTLGSSHMIRAMHQVIRLSHSSQLAALNRYFSQSRPDIVVSLIPHFNRAIQESLNQVWPGVPCVTVLTDIADYPPHFWMEPPDSHGNPQHVICGSERAEAQARQIGLPCDCIFRTSGMILHPRFYEPIDMDRGVERTRIGLRPEIPTGLVLFGGEGSAEMVEIAEALDQADTPLQLIMLCGKNADVAAKLRSRQTQEGEKRVPMFVEGFTRDIPLYMELADFFIGKPGPGSISEALAKRLPVIVERNSWTLAHEKYNADWVEEQGFGLVVRVWGEGICGAVERLLAPENYSGFRQRVANTRNRAVFEIPAMLDEILTRPEKAQYMALIASR